MGATCDTRWNMQEWEAASIHVTIPESRALSVEVPSNVPTGGARLLVMVAGNAPAVTSRQEPPVQKAGAGITHIGLGPLSTTTYYTLNGLEREAPEAGSTPWEFKLQTATYQKPLRFPDLFLGGKFNLAVKSERPDPFDDEPSLVLSGSVEARSLREAGNLAADLGLAFLGALVVEGWAAHGNPRPSAFGDSDVDFSVSQDGGPGNLMTLDGRRRSLFCDTRLEERADLSDTERHALGADRDKFLAAALRLAARPFTCKGERARTIRAALRLMLLADGSCFPGESIFYYVALLEGLLVESEHRDASAVRVAEAVAYSVGTDYNERTELKKTVARLYKLRSRYVHDGDTNPDADDLDRAREIACRIVRKEIRMLPNGEGGPARPL